MIRAGERTVNTEVEGARKVRELRRGGQGSVSLSLTKIYCY
jgi:hypothetical protein